MLASVYGGIICQASGSLGSSASTDIGGQIFVKLCSEHGSYSVSQANVTGHRFSRGGDLEVLERREILILHQVCKTGRKPCSQTNGVIVFAKCFSVEHGYSEKGEHRSRFESSGTPVG